MNSYLDVVTSAKQASYMFSNTSFELRKKCVLAISDSLVLNIDKILEANKLDLDSCNLTGSFKKRLELNKSKILEIASYLKELVMLDDVVGQIISSDIRPNGLKINKVSVAFGVILAIFESRPNVCIDIACLCLLTSNVCILRGGKESINTNKCLVNIMRSAISEFVSSDAINLIEDTNKEIVDKLISMNSYIDLVVPRGGKGLINYIVSNSLVPVIETGAGVCHIYVDKLANLDMAFNIISNAKLSNPSVCNACECLLIHEDIVYDVLKTLENNKFFEVVDAYGCEKVQNIIKCRSVVDYSTEFNDLAINIKVVSGIDMALSHIAKYGTKHSEVIITDDFNLSTKFLNMVDAACVYVNASSRFSDGGCFGFGAELGISTGKMHARGPMGLKEMTTYKYMIYGNGQTR